jgi:hypothetical protein
MYARRQGGRAPGGSKAVGGRDAGVARRIAPRGRGVVYLAGRFRQLSAAERGRIDGFIGDLWRSLHDATASPFDGVNEFLADTFVDIRRRLQRLGLERR